MVQHAVEHGQELTGADFVDAWDDANRRVFSKPAVDPDQPIRLTTTRSRSSEDYVTDRASLSSDPIGDG